MLSNGTTPITYAGGVDYSDVELLKLSNSKLDLTVGSSLDIWW